MKNFMEYLTQTVVAASDPWTAMLCAGLLPRSKELIAWYDPNTWWLLWCSALELNHKTWKILLDTIEETLSLFLQQVKEGVYQPMGAYEARTREQSMQNSVLIPIKLEPFIVASPLSRIQAERSGLEA